MGYAMYLGCSQNYYKVAISVWDRSKLWTVSNLLFVVWSWLESGLQSLGIKVCNKYWVGKKKNLFITIKKNVPLPTMHFWAFGFEYKTKKVQRPWGMHCYLVLWYITNCDQIWENRPCGDYCWFELWAKIHSTDLPWFFRLSLFEKILSSVFLLALKRCSYEPTLAQAKCFVWSTRSVIDCM